MVAQFRGYLEGQSAVVVDVPSKDGIPSAIAAYLRSQNLAMTVRSGSDPYFADVPWSKEPTLTVDKGGAEPKDETGLSHARAGISETGTLVLTSGPENPVTLNYLPENCTSLSLKRRISLAAMKAAGRKFASVSAKASCRARSTSSPGRRGLATLAAAS